MRQIHEIEKYHILESTSFDGLIEQVNNYPNYTIVNMYHLEHAPNKFIVFYAIIVEYSEDFK